MKFRRQQPQPTDINLTPLIDVVFLLLLFFVVTTTFTQETELTLELPQAASGEPVDNRDMQQLELSISAGGEVAVNGNVLIISELESIKAALQRESAGDSNLPVVIRADAQTPHQAVIMAMDAAGQLGFTRLRLVTSEMEAGGQQ